MFRLSEQSIKYYLAVGVKVYNARCVYNKYRVDRILLRFLVGIGLKNNP